MEIFNKIHSALIGGIGGKTVVIKKTGAQIGVDGAAYVTGDIIGDQGAIRLDDIVSSDYKTGIIQSITIKDLTKQSIAIDVLFFDALPSGTFTDNAAVDPLDGDIGKIVGHVSILAGDYAAFNDNSVATKTGIGLPFSCRDTTYPKAIWMVLTARGSATWTADELSIDIGILQD